MPNAVTITDVARELAQMIIDDNYEYSHCCGIARFDRAFHCGSPVVDASAIRSGRRTASRWLFMAEMGADKYQACFDPTEDDEPLFSVIDLLGTALMLAEYYQQHISEIAPTLYTPLRPRHTGVLCK